jgi:hypothetical protein
VEDTRRTGRGMEARVWRGGGEHGQTPRGWRTRVGGTSAQIAPVPRGVFGERICQDITIYFLLGVFSGGVDAMRG